MNSYNARKQSMQQLIQQFVTASDEPGRQRITSALLRVTPGLAGFSNPATGTGANNPSEEAAPKGDNSKQDPQVNMASQIQKELDAYRRELKDAIEREIEATKRQYELASNERTADLLGNDQNTMEQVNVLSKNLEERVRNLENQLHLLALQ